MLRCRSRPPPWVVLRAVRWLSRIAPPSPATAEPIIRVSNNVARLGEPKEGPKPRQLLSLPPFPSTGTDPLPGRKKDPAAGGQPRRVTAISWVKHYFADIPPEVIQSHFNKGLVLLNNGKAERVILAHPSGIDGSQDAITEYRVMGPTINGCSWVELRPLTGRKHQLRVHCAEALGTPIVGDYKYGWFVHQRWKQMPRADYETLSGKPYKLRRPEGLEVQKGSVLSKVPLLHLHCREMVIPNISKFLGSSGEWLDERNPWSTSKPDLLRIVAPMPSHMKRSWNVMSSFLV
ncbi:hypothetical protein BHE74_00032527 [Ensete ventricosum]|nr:hypothetical protein GW17_00008074 [Ensete ventricosum]RWW60478.1 hypothetical protein BHE74_00032527 [Ensete ventricosum]RZR96726.1 hypothetical protein BHM03_00025786 [Ensete ventricosum]